MHTDRYARLRTLAAQQDSDDAWQVIDGLFARRWDATAINSAVAAGAHSADLLPPLSAWARSSARRASLDCEAAKVIATQMGLEARDPKVRAELLPHPRPTIPSAAAVAVLDHAPFPTAGLVGAHGACRRLRALAVQGWDLESLAPLTGLDVATLATLRATASSRPQIPAAQHAVVAHVATRLAEGRTGPVPGPNAAEAQWARVKPQSWAPMLAFDDIDDPAYRVTRGRGAAAEGKLSDARMEDLEWLVKTGANWDRVCERSPWSNRESVVTACRRAGRLDLVARLDQFAKVGFDQYAAQYQALAAAS